MTKDPKDLERDEPLGRALRQSLEPQSGADVFATRVMAHVASPRARTWDLLAGWGRWGLVAAAAVVIVTVASVRHGSEVSVEATLATSDHAAANELMADDSPGVDVLFADASEQE